jgi:DNA-binding Xre family transcriptional regulator
VAIKWKLRTVLERLEVKPFALANTIGMASPQMYKLLRGDGPQNVNRETLSRLIAGLNELGHSVAVSDLLEYEVKS